MKKDEKISNKKYIILTIFLFFLIFLAQWPYAMSVYPNGETKFLFIFFIFPGIAAEIVKIFLLNLLKSKEVQFMAGKFILIALLEFFGFWIFIYLISKFESFLPGAMVYLAVFPFVNLFLLKRKGQGYPTFVLRIKDYAKAFLLSIILPLIILLNFVVITKIWGTGNLPL